MVEGVSTEWIVLVCHELAHHLVERRVVCLYMTLSLCFYLLHLP
jgi:hypothetical protein